MAGQMASGARAKAQAAANAATPPGGTQLPTTQYDQYGHPIRQETEIIGQDGTRYAYIAHNMAFSKDWVTQQQQIIAKIGKQAWLAQVLDTPAMKYFAQFVTDPTAYANYAKLYAMANDGRYPVPFNYPVFSPQWWQQQVPAMGHDFKGWVDAIKDNPQWEAAVASLPPGTNYGTILPGSTALNAAGIPWGNIGEVLRLEGKPPSQFQGIQDWWNTPSLRKDLINAGAEIGSFGGVPLPMLLDGIFASIGVNTST